LEQIEESIGRGAPCKALLRNYKTNGRMFWNEISIAPIRNEAGEVTHLVGLHHDVTERVTALHALQTSEKNFRTLAESISYGMTEIDMEGTLLYANPAYHRIYGYPNGSMIGKTLADFAASEDERQNITEFFDYLRRELPPPETFYGQRIAPDGSALDVKIDWDYKRNIDDEIVGIFSIVSDITQEKKNEERLQAMSRELARADQRTRQRISADLHDTIGQDLAFARMQLGQLERMIPDDEQKKAIEDIRDLLKASLSRVRNLSFEIDPSNLVRLDVPLALESLAREIGTRYDFECRCEIVETLPPASQEIKTLMFRTIRELLINIGKHAEAPEARLSLKLNKGEFVVEVEDHGVGFTSNRLDDIVLNTDGLGLFNIINNLKQVNGTLKLRSKPGAGAIMILRLPCEVQDSEPGET
ncbi:MAG: PAS domain S-box protein, partial [Verrucomicrobiota bacterium]